MKFCVLTITLSIFSIIFSSVHAQERIETESAISWGLSYTHSDATLDRLGLMFSTSYTHKIYNNLYAEAGIHFTGSSVYISAPLQSAWYILAQHTIISDIAALYCLHQIIPNLRIGVGASIRLHNLLESNKLVGFSTVTGQQILNSYALGANTKVDYGFLIAENIELVLRGQIHLFLPAFMGYQNSITSGSSASVYPNGGGLSLGAFLRIGF